MVEPTSLHCPRCASTDLRPVGATSPIRDSRYQHCENCGLKFVAASEHERHDVAKAGFEADLRALDVENKRLKRQLDNLRSKLPK